MFRYPINVCGQSIQPINEAMAVPIGERPILLTRLGDNYSSAPSASCPDPVHLVWQLQVAEYPFPWRTE
jgi:hypothetical protein|tara:strand:- start:120 stop:326 length:207 start_codon:yes stop_codon:yes gene_type:complete